MSNSEEQLYHACMTFCKSFFHLLCEKEKMRKSRLSCDSYERRRTLEFSEEMLNSDYEKLFRAIEDFENDKQGVIGENQYRLELKKVK